MVQSFVNYNNVMARDFTQALWGLKVVVLQSLLLQAVQPQATQCLQRSSTQQLLQQKEILHQPPSCRTQQKEILHQPPSCRTEKQEEQKQLQEEDLSSQPQQAQTGSGQQIQSEREISRKFMTQQEQAPFILERQTYFADDLCSFQAPVGHVDKVSPQGYFQQKSSPIWKVRSFWRQIFGQNEPEHQVDCFSASTEALGSMGLKSCQESDRNAPAFSTLNNSLLPFSTIAVITLVSLNIETILLQIFTTAKTEPKAHQLLNKLHNLCSLGQNTNSEDSTSDSVVKDLLQWFHFAQLKTLTFL